MSFFVLEAGFGSVYSSEMKQETDNPVNVNVRFWDHNTDNNINLCAKEKAQQFYETFLSEETSVVFQTTPIV